MAHVQMVEIYEGRGMNKEDATSVINTMAKYPDLFVDAMMRDELGMDEPGETMDHVKSGVGGLAGGGDFLLVWRRPALVCRHRHRHISSFSAWPSFAPHPRV